MPKGYYTNGYYYGFIEAIGKYLRFVNETEYIEFLRDNGVRV